jgi:hypothetical protein
VCLACLCTLCLVLGNVYYTLLDRPPRRTQASTAKDLLQEARHRSPFQQLSDEAKNDLSLVVCRLKFDEVDASRQLVALRPDDGLEAEDSYTVAHGGRVYLCVFLITCHVCRVPPFPTHTQHTHTLSTHIPVFV